MFDNLFYFSSISSAFGWMLKRDCCKRNSPLLRLKCTQFASRKNTNACTLGKSLKEKGTKTLFQAIAIEVYCNIAKNSFFFLLLCNFFRCDFNFNLCLFRHFASYFAKKCLWFQFFSTSVAQLSKNLNFWWFWAISLVKCWARNWFSSLQKCDVDDDEGRISACLESQSQRSANPRN